MSVFQSINRNRPTIAALLIGALVMYVLVTWLVNQKLETLSSLLEEQIITQQNTLVALSVITARNGADATVESIIQDCSGSERTRFDTLLSALNRNLTQVELQELDRLFGRCAGFFAARKGLMVARLERELEIYRLFIDQRHRITPNSETIVNELSQWQELVTAEKKMSEGFATLVTLQDNIIQALLAGEIATSPVITELLNTVSQVQDTLSVTNTQVRALRGELVPADA